jgi:sugar/nucleoside kinase (ribokinase family)
MHRNECEARKMNILVIGSIALDTVETPSGKVEDSPGGSALYFSCAASLFAPVNIVGIVGSDFDFNQINFIKNRSINIDGIYIEEGKTFRWGGRYHTNLNQRDTLYTHLNVFENFKPVIPNSYRQSNLVFLANIDPVLQLQVLDQIEGPRLVVLDTMNYWINGSREQLTQVIRRCDILILNDEETRELTLEDNLVLAARKILDLGPQNLIIKKGEHGAVLIGSDFYFATPAFPLGKVVDPTGAGDSFAGGFVGFLAKVENFSQENLRKALVYGTIIASFNVEDFSFNKLVKLSPSILEERYRQFREITTY